MNKLVDRHISTLLECILNDSNLTVSTQQQELYIIANNCVYFDEIESVI